MLGTTTCLADLDRHLRSAEPVGPNDHVAVAEEQGFAVCSTGQLVEIVTNPIRPQIDGVAGEAGDPEALGERGDRNEGYRNAIRAEPLTERDPRLRAEKCERLLAAVVEIEFVVSGGGLVEPLHQRCE